MLKELKYLNNKNILLGICGGISAYKAAELVSQLKKMGANIKVIMTKSATEFITPLTFQTLSQNYVITDMFDEVKNWEVEHITLTKWADAFVITSATANILGKTANGIADDMLSTTIMAAKIPVIFVPAMNTNMYENPIVQDNIEKLKRFGYKFIEPSTGYLACGDIGKGKLPDTDVIIENIINALCEKVFKNKRVLVTAGPTREKIDPVRYISNFSSGKMGYAIAEEFALKGAEVILISGPSNIKCSTLLKIIKVESADEMYKEAIKEFETCDIAVMCAAVADYRPLKEADSKIKKDTNLKRPKNMVLELTPNKDILKHMGEIKKSQVLVGFAAETDDLLENAAKKLKNKNLDMIIANQIGLEGSGFNCDTNIIKIIKKDGTILEYSKMSKEEVSKEISSEIFKII